MVVKRFSCRYLSLFCLFFIFSVVSAKNKEYEKVMEIALPDKPFFGSLSIRVDTNEKWVLDLGNDYAIEVTPWKNKSADYYWDPVVEYRLFAINGGQIVGEALATTNIATSDSKTGISLSQRNSQLLVCGANGQSLFDTAEERIEPLKEATQIKLLGTDKIHVLKTENRFEAYPEMQNVGRYTVDSIEPDEHSGKWVYFDMITPKNGSVRVGGKYELDVIPDPAQKGALQLVYRKGANNNSDFWKNGDVKAKLIPTSFPNHYDLVWIDTQGNTLINEEASATFEGQNLLTLEFPMHQSQLRFRRIEESEPR